MTKLFILALLAVLPMNAEAGEKDTLEKCLKRAQRVYDKKMEKLEAQNLPIDLNGVFTQEATVHLFERQEACRHQFSRAKGSASLEGWTCAEDVECQNSKIDAMSAN